MDISILVGKILQDIKITDHEIVFIVSEDEQYKLYHEQDCCESVVIDDICGDINDLIGATIYLAQEVSNDNFVEDFENSFTERDEWGYKTNKNGAWAPESYTWTFYKLATIKGYVDIRWYGESNGYYSEGVDFIKL